MSTNDNHRIAQRTAEALHLRLAGCTYRDLADRLGISTTQAFKDVKRALADIPAAEAEELRQVECARLDALQSACWDQSLNGDLNAAKQALRIIETRARLLGLNAPARVDVKSTDVDLDATVDKIMAAAVLVAAGDQVEAERTAVKG